MDAVWDSKEALRQDQIFLSCPEEKRVDSEIQLDEAARAVPEALWGIIHQAEDQGNVRLRETVERNIEMYFYAQPPEVSVGQGGQEDQSLLRR